MVMDITVQHIEKTVSDETAFLSGVYWTRANEASDRSDGLAHPFTDSFDRQIKAHQVAALNS